jgi:cyclophilin family peptidyl-prolyl cis-trans isomerase
VRARSLTVSLFTVCRTGGRTTEQFEDEIHPRLRFAHRGLVAMANNGKKNSNDSQFFITLGAVQVLLHACYRPQFSLGMM